MATQRLKGVMPECRNSYCVSAKIRPRQRVDLKEID